MTAMEFAELATLASDPDNGWSIGSFGAIGEFFHDPGEASLARTAAALELHTTKGGMRLGANPGLRPIAWERLSADGEGWSFGIDFCCPQPAAAPRAIACLGADADAIRTDDRGQMLFDLGVGVGAVRMAVRTRDPALIAELEANAGRRLPDDKALDARIRAHQPQRVLLSPAGRIEVYQPIPAPDGKSPDGPHTHLLLNLVPKNRPHGANSPLPDGWQSVLSVSLPSPWRDKRGARHAFCAARDTAFQPMLRRFGLPAEQQIERDLRALVLAGAEPHPRHWPDTRRGRTKARIALRRLAAEGVAQAQPWRAMFDRHDAEQKEEN